MSEDQPISENLKEYYKAAQEEFELTNKSTSDSIARKGLEELTSLLPEALETLQAIMRNGDKDDTIRFSASKLIIEYVLGKPTLINNKESDLDRIIEGLRATPVSTD